jgi:hypothetical protein
MIVDKCKIPAFVRSVSSKEIIRGITIISIYRLADVVTVEINRYGTRNHFALLTKKGENC